MEGEGERRGGGRGGEERIREERRGGGRMGEERRGEERREEMKGGGRMREEERRKGERKGFMVFPNCVYFIPFKEQYLTFCSSLAA